MSSTFAATVVVLRMTVVGEAMLDNSRLVEDMLEIKAEQSVRIRVR